VQNIQLNIEVGELNFRASCRVTKFHHKQFITWKSDILTMQGERNKKAKSMCLGPSSILHAFKEQLYVTYLSYRSEEWLFHQDWLLLKHHLCPGNFERGRQVQYCSVQYFINLHGLVHQIGINILQHDPRELEDRAAAFMAMVCPMVTGPSRDSD